MHEKSTCHTTSVEDKAK